MISEVKIRLMTFPFFCKYLNFNAWAFLPCDFVACLGQKSVQMFISMPLFLKTSWFRKKKENIIWFSNKKWVHQQLSCVYDTSEICEKVGGLDGKMTQNRQKTCTFSFFFLEKPLSLKKNFYFILYCKNKKTCQFHAFMIKKWLRKYIRNEQV